MHNQAINVPWLLSVHHAVNCQTSCSQLHFSKFSIQLLRGRKEDCKTKLIFHDIVDVSFPLYVIFNKKGVIFVYRTSQSPMYSGLWIGQLTKIEVGENQVWPIKNILN